MKTLLSLVLATAPLALSSPPQRLVAQPKILGVAHLAVFVSDLAKARAFYQDLLGLEESFTLPKADGTVEIAFVKIDDRQWIELFNRPKAAKGSSTTSPSIPTMPTGCATTWPRRASRLPIAWQRASG